jgi:hypothetical protein
MDIEGTDGRERGEVIDSILDVSPSLLWMF